VLVVDGRQTARTTLQSGELLYLMAHLVENLAAEARCQLEEEVLEAAAVAARLEEEAVDLQVSFHALKNRSNRQLIVNSKKTHFIDLNLLKIC